MSPETGLVHGLCIAEGDAAACRSVSPCVRDFISFACACVSLTCARVSALEEMWNDVAVPTGGGCFSISWVAVCM